MRTDCKLAGSDINLDLQWESGKIGSMICVDTPFFDSLANLAI